MYFSVADTLDNGAIVNFIQNRSSKTLPEIANELNEWLGQESEISKPKYYAPDIEEQEFDPERVQKIFKGCKIVQSHPYLAGRGITSALLSSKRFWGRIYIDKYKRG